MNVYILNVGKGNCSIIEHHTDRLTMIDIDNSRLEGNERILTDPVAFYLNKFKDRTLFRFILTHPDMDHMSGLYELSNKVSIANFWGTNHTKEIDDWEGSPYNPEDWETQQLFNSSEENPKSIKNLRNETAECCWVEDGIKILSPSENLINNANETEEYNHLSYVLMIEYAGRKILFGGDATVESWEEIGENYSKEELKSDFFVAPHHGSKNNVHEDVFKMIDPDYVLVSVAEGVEYDYDYYSELANYRVLSTKYYGTIEIPIDETGEFKLYVERNAD